MPANTATRLRGLRLLAVLALLILCTGGILYSARSIRYPVDGKPTTEYQVTKLSLTHEVDRGPNGKLTNPYADAALPTAPSRTVAGSSSPSLVRVASVGSGASSKAMAAKKPAVKKPAPKPTIKKPAPKKPAPKKPAKKKPRACPT